MGTIVEPIKVEKPWGHEMIWAHTDRYAAKVLFIKEGHRLSKQFHVMKEETIRVQSGTMTLWIYPDEAEPVEHVMNAGDIRHIAPGVVHRMSATTDVYVDEVSTSQLDDVVRVEDDYGR